MVYSNSFILLPKVTLAEVIPVIEKWIESTSGELVAFTGGKSQSFIGRDGSLVKILESDTSAQVILTTPDPRDGKREWITIISVAETTPNHPLEVSVSLGFKGPSPKKVFLNPPRIVDQIAQAFASTDTPGVRQTLVREDALRALSDSLSSEDRSWPVVLATPMKKGGYAVDLEKLRARLVGWASLHVVPEDADFGQIKDVMGPEHYCFNGAVNVIMPIGSSAQGGLVLPGKEGNINFGYNEQQILSKVARFANDFHAQRQIHVTVHHAHEKGNMGLEP